MTTPPEEIYLAAVEGGGTTFVVSVGRVVAVPSSQQDQNKNSRECESNAQNDHVGKGKNILQIGPTSIEILATATIPPSPELTWSPSRILEETCLFLQSHRPPPSSKKSTPNQDESKGEATTAPAASYSAVGIATFGPAGVNPSQSSTFGTILGGSPKKEWRNIDLITPIIEACGLSIVDGKDNTRASLCGSNSDGGLRYVGFDTDVNAPALAEFRHRQYCMNQQSSSTTLTQQQQLQSTKELPSSTPLTSLAYITIGTGVGVGLILNSHPVHGLLHPEGGHLCVQPLEGDTFKGYSWGKEKSPYQGLGTVEGMASSVALTERWIMMQKEEQQLQTENEEENNNNSEIQEEATAQTREILSTLPDTHPLWSHASNAIANLCVSLLLLNSIQTIVLGGGIMKRTILFQMVRERVYELLNGYLDSVEELSSAENLKRVIVESSWSESGVGSGLAGAFALALDAYEKEKIQSTQQNQQHDQQKQQDQIEEAEYAIEKKSNDSERKWFSSGFWVGVIFTVGVTSMVSAVFGRGVHRKH